MKYTIHSYLLFFTMLHYATLFGPSMVYNFRIAEVTRQPIFEKSNKLHHTVIALPFEQYRKKYDGTKQNFTGGLASYIYDFSSNYFRTDFAVSHIKETIGHTTTFSGTEADDILLTLGRNFDLSDRTSITTSGLLGIPTHKIFRLQHVDFGYSQVGLGMQLDGLYAFNRMNDFVYGARYIYFFPRKAHDTLDEKHRFTIGNVGDLLVAYKKNWKHHGLELGYTSRFRFGAHICPNLDEIVKKTNYIRSNFYLVYKYKFLINNIPNRLLFNIGYGFDESPKKFGNKYIITLWASWNVNF